MQYMIKTNNQYRAPFEYLIPIDYILSHKDKWAIYDFQYLKDLDKDIIEDILLNKKLSGAITDGYDALEFIDKNYIIKNKLWKKVSITITYLSSKGFVIDDIEKYNMENMYWSTQIHGKEYPKKRMENISVYVGGKYKDYEWRKVDQFIDELGLEFSSFGSSRNYGNTNNYKLLFNLIRFYNYDLYTSIAFYKKLEISYDEKLLFEVIDNLIQKGLNLKEYNVYELVKEISSTSSSVENYIKVILHYKLENLYKDSFELAKKNTISYDRFKDLEGKGYDSDLNKIKNHLEITYLREKINPLYSSMGARETSEKDMKEIYEFFVKKIPGLKWIKTNEYSHWDSDKELIGLFYLLVHLNKLDEFKKEKFEFDTKTLSSVYRVICGTSRGNGRKCCGIPLTKEDNERAFKWLKENYIKNALTDWENSGGLEMALPSLYKYDKELFDKVFNKLITLKRKYSYFHNDKKVYKENCIDNFKVFFNYLLSEKDPLEPKEEEFYISECEKYYDKIVSTMKRKNDKLEVIRYLLRQHEFGHVSSRRNKLEQFLKSKKDELTTVS